MSYTPEQLREWAYDRSGIIDADWLSDQLRAHADALETIAKLKALGEMLAAVLQGAKEEFVRVPYGASHEDVAAINDWHKMAAEALREWESGK